MRNDEDMKKASILIPVYNAEKTLRRCIESALSQTWENTEIILVNDGSTDSSPAICHEYAERHPSVKVIDQKNGGLAAVRNVSVAASSGDYIFFLDSDDYVTPDFVEKPIRALERNGADICVFGFISSFVDEGKKKSHHVRKERLLGREEAFRGLLKDGYINNLSWNKCYRRELFEGISFPDGKVFEDIATTYKLFDRAERICIIPDILHSYEIRTESISYRWWYDERKTADYFDARMDQFGYIRREFPSLLPEAYAATAHGALMCSLHMKEGSVTRKRAEDFLSNNRNEICRSSLPFGPLFRLCYRFPGFVRRNAGRFGL